MMDWNGDGKFDAKDDAFYNNVLSNDCKQKANGSNAYSSKNNHAPDQQSYQGNGWLWWILILFIYLLIKLI